MEEMESTGVRCTYTLKQENIHSNQQSWTSDLNNCYPKISEQDILAMFDNNGENFRYYLGLKEAMIDSRQRGDKCVCDPRDLSMVARLEQSNWQPRVVLKPVDEPACSEGSVFGLSSKQTALDRHEEGGDCADDNAVDTKQELQAVTNRPDREQGGGESASFSCGVNGCCQRFTSLASYESHYHTSHNFVCATCKRSFVSNFLLDVHLEENHDSYFQILSPRVDMYRCLVESCMQKFRTAELRKDHLVTQHKFPASFSFHRPIKPKSQKPKGSKSSAGLETEDNSMEGSRDAPSPAAPQSSASPSSPAAPAMEVDRSEHQARAGQFGPAGKPGRRGSNSAGGRGSNSAGGRGRKVPPVVCFGRGSQRAFQRRGRGGRGRHWHQMGAMDVDTTVDIEKVDFGDMADSLGECS